MTRVNQNKSHTTKDSCLIKSIKSKRKKEKKKKTQPCPLGTRFLHLRLTSCVGKIRSVVGLSHKTSLYSWIQTAQAFWCHPRKCSPATAPGLSSTTAALPAPQNKPTPFFSAWVKPSLRWASHLTRRHCIEPPWSRRQTCTPSALGCALAAWRHSRSSKAPALLLILIGEWRGVAGWGGAAGGPGERY